MKVTSCATAICAIKSYVTVLICYIFKYYYYPFFYHTVDFRKRQCPASARRWADVGLVVLNLGLMSRV